MTTSETVGITLFVAATAAGLAYLAYGKTPMVEATGRMIELRLLSIRHIRGDRRSWSGLRSRSHVQPEHHKEDHHES